MPQSLFWIHTHIDLLYTIHSNWSKSLQWRHNGLDSVWNHQPHVYSSVYSGADQRKHQSSASLTFVRGILRRPVNSPHKGPVTRKMFPFDDIIMYDPIIRKVLRTRDLLVGSPELTVMIPRISETRVLKIYAWQKQRCYHQCYHVDVSTF